MSSSTSRPLGLLTFPTLLSLVIFSTLFVHLLNHARVFEQGAGHLSKRAPDSPYVTAGNKGDQWVCNLANAPPTTSQTKFTDYDQLEQNGWTDSGDHPAPNTLDELKELTDPLKNIGVTDQSQFQYVGMLQDQPFGNNEDPTDAQFSDDYETTQGVIIATNNYAPDPKKGPVPDLKAWSDVIFLTWANLCSKGGDIKSLKNVFRYHIKPDTTPSLGVVLQAVGAKTVDDVKIWPPNQPSIDGQTFDADSDQGKALIGTPHGNGVGWLMWQHQDQLGKKTFDKVTVFKTTDAQGKAWANINFGLKDQ